MTAPKTETIRRYCSSETAIDLLRERGIVSDLEAEAMFARARRQSDKGYARIYSTSMARLVADVLEEIDAPETVVEAAREAALAGAR